MSLLIEQPSSDSAVNHCDQWQVSCWTSLDSLAANATAWNDLWERSSVTSPLCRAEPLLVWLGHFANPSEIRIWVAQSSDGRLLGGLPLLEVGSRLWPHLALAGNVWSSAGDLLFDSQRAQGEVLLSILRQACSWPHAWVHFQQVDLTADHWHLLRTVTEQSRGVCYLSAHDKVGLIDTDGSWEDYLATRSRNLRRQMRQVDRRLDRIGGSELVVLDKVTPEEIERLLHRGFRVEDKSWKGAAGSSVLHTRGMFDFFVSQAKALAASGHLYLVFLEHKGQPISFEYGLSAKGTYFSPKVGYDPEFAEYCPGQLLRWKLLERFHEDPRRHLVDFSGPLVAATQRWITRSYPVADLRILPRSWRARMMRPLLAGYSQLKKLRQSDAKAADAREEDADDDQG